MTEWLSIFKINALRYESQIIPFLSDKKNRQYHSTEKNATTKTASIATFEVENDVAFYPMQLIISWDESQHCFDKTVHCISCAHRKVAKQIVAPVILGKSPNCFNKLLWEWYCLKNHSATSLQRFRDIVHPDIFDCISAHYPSLFPSQSHTDSYPWHRHASWEWARQHWRCNYLNVLKHSLD